MSLGRLPASRGSESSPFYATVGLFDGPDICTSRYGAVMKLLADADLPDRITLDDDLVIQADNAEVLPRLDDAAFDLIYIDPPFNTGRAQARTQIAVTPDPS